MPSVMVTGAWSNLGQAIVEAFHREGYTIYGTARTLRQDSRISRCYALDLSGEDIAFDGLEELDVLVNNAGLFTETSIEDFDEDDWHSVFDLNVRGLILVTKALLPALRRREGSIVNVSSMNAVHPGFGRTAHYDASKGAVSALTRSLASETGLRVNAVQPGLIARAQLSGSDLEAYWKGHSVRASMMEPADIAEAVLFLAQSRGIYGQCLTVDNGFTLC